jgi:hypothetical protein
MRTAIALMVLASVLLLPGIPAAAQIDLEDIPVKASADVDYNEVYIGDRITYIIEAAAEKDIEVRLPFFREGIEGFEIKGFTPTEKKARGGRKIFIHRFTLISFDPGAYTIPPAIIKWRRPDEDGFWEIETAPIEIEIKSVLAETAGAVDIMAIKGPVNIGYVFPKKAVTAALVLMALFALAGYLLMRYKDRAPPAPPKSPHVIAYEALRDLKMRELITQGRVKEYYIGLSDIVRHYLEGRFRLRAPEMTTEEFLEEAKRQEELSSDHKGLLRDFMSHCDLVKFAKYGPSDKEIGASFDSAKRLVDQTKQDDKGGTG